MGSPGKEPGCSRSVGIMTTPSALIDWNLESRGKFVHGIGITIHRTSETRICVAVHVAKRRRGFEALSIAVSKDTRYATSHFADIPLHCRIAPLHAVGNLRLCFLLKRLIAGAQKVDPLLPIHALMATECSWVPISWLPRTQVEAVEQSSVLHLQGLC